MTPKTPKPLTPGPGLGLPPPPRAVLRTLGAPREPRGISLLRLQRQKALALLPREPPSGIPERVRVRSGEPGCQPQWPPCGFPLNRREGVSPGVWLPDGLAGPPAGRCSGTCRRREAGAGHPALGLVQADLSLSPQLACASRALAVQCLPRRAWCYSWLPSSVRCRVPATRKVKGAPDTPPTAPALAGAFGRRRAGHCQEDVGVAVGELGALEQGGRLCERMGVLVPTCCRVRGLGCEPVGAATPGCEEGGWTAEALLTGAARLQLTSCSVGLRCPQGFLGWMMG